MATTLPSVAIATLANLANSTSSPSPSEARGQGEGSQSFLKPEIRARIGRVVQEIQPFHIQLWADPPGFVCHEGDSKTVWLPVTTEKVQQLQAALQEEFAEVNADRRGFFPYLTVGQVNSIFGMERLRTLVTKRIAEHLDHNPDEKAKSVALDWHVDQVCVIERKTKYDRFKIVETIKLGEQ